jgi:glutathione S-transferase
MRDEDTGVDLSVGPNRDRRDATPSQADGLRSGTCLCPLRDRADPETLAPTPRNDPTETRVLTLYFSPTSPFVRKVLATAIELGIEAEIERIESPAHPVNRNQTIIAKNPLGQVPTLITDDGTVLYDSRVICDYLNARANGRIIPADGMERWRALTEQSLADGLLNAALLVRYERTLRPEAARWSTWETGQTEKIVSALDALEDAAAGFGDRIDIGTIAAGCGLGYLDFRLPDLGWREGRAALAGWFDRISTRPSFANTMPVG